MMHLDELPNHYVYHLPIIYYFPSLAFVILATFQDQVQLPHLYFKMFWINEDLHRQDIRKNTGVCVVRIFFFLMELLYCQLHSSNVHCTVLSPRLTLSARVRRRWSVVLNSFLFPPPVCFSFTVQNVTYKAFFLSSPNVLNLGNFSPAAGSQRLSWQSDVP